MRRWRDFAVILSLFVVVSVWAVGISIYYSDNSTQGQTAAAWFQAIGSVLAIFAAFDIAERQSKASREAIKEEQRLTERFKKNGTLAVVRAAKTHATSIGEAMKTPQPSLALYQVYDKSIVNGIVGTLANAPVYELGSTEAVLALLSLRDQFVFLGNAVEKYLDGPWQDEQIGRLLQDLQMQGEHAHVSSVRKATEEQFSLNVQEKVTYIQSRCEMLENSLSLGDKHKE